MHFRMLLSSLLRTMLCYTTTSNGSFDARVNELPEDFDFFSLFVPRDSDHLYTTEKSAGWFVCKTYQRYGGVSMYYSKKGAEKIQGLLERDGITGQYDDTLYEYSKNGELNGYCSKPSIQDLVYITGAEESIVQETDLCMKMLVIVLPVVGQKNIGSPRAGDA